MIELKIMGETAAEIMRDLRELVGSNEPAKIDFAAAKAQEAKVVAAQDVRNRAVSEAITQTYEPDTSDEAEVDPEIVQGESAVSRLAGEDSAGDEWDEAIHSPNKTMTKDGRWRLKKGAVRPEPVVSPAQEPSDPAEPAQPTSSAPDAPSDEEDEFAAFAEAMAEEPAEAPEVMARTWTDADLSRLCNQAAQKMGNPAPIKDTIGKFVPEGEVPHSRNVPVEGREDFAQAIEKLAGIEYAG
jgi:hypothetical protein